MPPIIPPPRKSAVRIVSIIGITVLLAGCAGVTFYSDSNLKQRTGLKYYIAKPYLLVARNAAKDTPLKVEVIQLPDLENPNYGVYKPGWGTHEFALKVTNGILTEYNQKADSKGPETISALADLASKAGSGFSSAATGFNALQKQAADVPAAIGAINLAIGDLNSALSAMPTTSKEAKDVRTAVDELRTVVAEITAGNANQKAKLEDIKKNIGNIAIEPTSPDAPKIKALLSAAQAQIDEAIKALAKGSGAPAEPPPASYELYEIRMENGETHLIPVKITKTTLRIIERSGQSHGK